MSKVSSRRVYTGRVLNLDVDSVRFPNGKVGELEMIRHPGASAVIPMAGDSEQENPDLLLIRQYRYAADGYLYEIPAGRLEPNEDPADCAKRELREETGCSASEIRFLTTMFTTPGFTDERIHLFVATGLTFGPTAHEEDEFMTVERVPFSRAVELVMTGEIRDGKTALAILYLSTLRASSAVGR